MPDWLLALLLVLGAMALAAPAGWLAFRILFASLYRRKPW